jgi:hypothetical protein
MAEPLPPVVLGGLLVVPLGLMAAMTGASIQAASPPAVFKHAKKICQLFTLADSPYFSKREAGFFMTLF